MFDDEKRESFDLRRAKLIQDDAIYRLAVDLDEDDDENRHPLDSPENGALQRRLIGLYRQELERQAENRYEMSVDEDYYDHIQWSAEDAAELLRRGQQPIVYNVTAILVDWVTGTQKRTRSDFKVLPRRKEQSQAAEQKTKLLKYLSDVNKSPFSVSAAFEDQVKAGLGWLESGCQDDMDGEPLFVRSESWRYILHDSAAMNRDLSDARYIFRAKWVDLDIATAMFPDRADVLRAASVDPLGFGGMSEFGDEAMDHRESALDVGSGGSQDLWTCDRRRVRLIECWYRRPVRVKRLRSTPGDAVHGDVFDENDRRHSDALARGATIVDAVMMRVHVAIMTEQHLLFEAPSPYRHNRFPFVPLWGRRRARDGMPYGMVRACRGPQQDINKRASKALYILSTNKVVMEEGAVEDVNVLAEEVARPDGIIVKKPGKMLDINVDRELAAPHMEMMSRDISLMQTMTGVTDESMGRTTNATSGRAIEARQTQGAMTTAGYFDNLRYAMQLQGEIELSLIEQYYDEQKSIRITNMRGTPDWVTINDGLPEDNITRTKADFVISEADWNATVRRAQVAELMELLKLVAPAAPQAALVALDLIVESMDVPSREEIVRRIRQLTGMRDPDAEEPSPEEIAQAEQAQRAAAMQQELLVAELEGKRATAAHKAAQAQKAAADADVSRSKTASTNADTLKKVLEAAVLMLSSPDAIPVADSIAHEAGFLSRTELEAVAEGEEELAAAAEGAALDAMQQQQPAQQTPADQPM